MRDDGDAGTEEGDVERGEGMSFDKDARRGRDEIGKVILSKKKGGDGALARAGGWDGHAWTRSAQTTGREEGDPLTSDESD